MQEVISTLQAPGMLTADQVQESSKSGNQCSRPTYKHSMLGLETERRYSITSLISLIQGVVTG